MIDWSEASPALVRLFTELAFDTTPTKVKAQWFGRTQSYTSHSVKTNLIMQVRSIQDIGEDETRYVERDLLGVPATVAAQVGNRRIIIQLKVESYENSDALWAWSTIGRLCTRLGRPSSQEALAAINFTRTATGPAVNAPTPREQHEWSAAAVDITFGARFEDAEGVAANWIERVEIQSQLSGTDGELLPDPALNSTRIIGPA